MRILGLLLLLAATMLAGCSRTVTWKEEVQLSDGRVIVVERETLRVSGGAGFADGGSGSRPKERRIRLENPDGSGKIVEWISTKADDRQRPETPLVLDISPSDSIFVISSIPVSSACDRYLKYVYTNGQWVDETLPDEFPQRPTNLTLLSGPSMPSLIKLADKRKELTDPGYTHGLRQVGPKRVACGI
jgi:hypothetical protein